MGGGTWDPGTYAATTRSKISSGTSFGYTSSTHTKSASSWAAHEDLDPKKVAGAASPLAGQLVRESRDSTEHPNSTPVACIFDCTGSMGAVPRTLQTKLTELFGLLLRKGYLEHPQILMGAYGDGELDRVPLQVSQFESDNRIDDALDNIFLEGGGGGNGGESQWLAWYYLAYHTATDAYEKRGKKGYAFFIGDESTLEPHGDQVKRLIGVDEAPANLTLEKIASDLKEKWDPYVLVIDNWSAKSQESIKQYTKLFGADHVIVVEDEEAIAETIALAIGLEEGVIDLDDGVDDLKEFGSSDTAIAKATKALAVHKNKGGVVKSEAPAGLDSADDDNVAKI